MLGRLFALQTLDGASVTVNVRISQLGYFEVAPKESLAPNTTYKLLGRWMQGSRDFEDEVQFTTGAGPVTEKPLPPVAKLQNLERVRDTVTSCDPEETQTCVAISGNAHVVIFEFIDAFGQTDDSVYVTHGPVFVTNLSPATQTATNFHCVKLRTRGVDASLSEPLTLCGRDAPTFRISGTSSVECVESGLIWGSGAKVMQTPSATPPDAGASIPPHWDAGMAVPDASAAALANSDASGEEQSDAAAQSFRHVKNCGVQSLPQRGSALDWALLVGFGGMLRARLRHARR